MFILHVFSTFGRSALFLRKTSTILKRAFYLLQIVLSRFVSSCLKSRIPTHTHLEFNIKQLPLKESGAEQKRWIFQYKRAGDERVTSLNWSRYLSSNLHPRKVFIAWEQGAFSIQTVFQYSPGYVFSAALYYLHRNCSFSCDIQKTEKLS